MDKKLAAVVPAAGLSSRMGTFKPLLRLDNISLIEHTVKNLEIAGVDEIIVVTGFQKEAVIRALAGCRVTMVYNPDFELGMYSSIQKGIENISPGCSGFFLLPGDCPLVKPGTIIQLISQFDIKSNFKIIYPLCHGKRGHPPLISTALASEILNSAPEGGLRTLLKTKENIAINLPVSDSGILLDADTPDDYQHLLQEVHLDIIPTPDECRRLLDYYGTPADVKEHSYKVYTVASRFSEALETAGISLHHVLLNAAAILHDIAKVEADHVQRGSALLKSWGYNSVADIIKFHMDIPEEKTLEINETAILYLADKLVHGETLMALEERQKRALNKYPHQPDIQDNIKHRYEKAREIRDQVESVLGENICTILSNEVE